MYEETLVEDFLWYLASSRTPWGKVRVTREFDYQRGRVDVVAVTDDGRVVAFEAKTLRWRDALHQAYRNTCLAHHSYVLLPEQTARAAQQHISEFERRGVGICYLCGRNLVILHESPKSNPIQPWLSSRVVESALRR